jgi:hypothetical protein
MVEEVSCAPNAPELIVFIKLELLIVRVPELMMKAPVASCAPNAPVLMMLVFIVPVLLMVTVPPAMVIFNGLK